MKQTLLQAGLADLDLDFWAMILLFVLPALGATIAYMIWRSKDADDWSG